MVYYKFTDGDILANALKTHPNYSFYIYGGNIYINSQPSFPGEFTSSVGGVPDGFISLYEYNVDRSPNPTSELTIPPDEDSSFFPTDTSMIYPFLTKDSTQGAFATVSTTGYNQFQYGALMTADYRLSASISKAFFESADKTTYANYINSLRNTLNYYTTLSPHYAFESSIGDNQWNKAEQEIGLVSIPSIFYGSSIKKGSVKLQFFISGTLAGELRDSNKDGELIQVSGTANEFGVDHGSGSVAGVVLYNEGFVLLTGSWALDPVVDQKEFYVNTSVRPRWKYFASTIQSSSVYSGSPTILTPSSSYLLEFDGTTHVPNITMFATAPRNELNHSNNPTYMKVTSSNKPLTSSYQYSERDNLPIKNVVSSSFVGYDESFAKTTYISKVGIYDEFKNLLGFAKLATPVKKTHEREFTFKLKLDI